MIIGIILKDKFYKLGCFLIQFSSDTKIYIKSLLILVGNLLTFYSSRSVRGSLLVFHLNPVIKFHVMAKRKMYVGMVGRGTWRTRGQEGREISAAFT